MMAALVGLFPPTDPYNCGRLQVTDIHNLYYEQCGNPTGNPLVLLHGGPGRGSSPRFRQFCDPDVYRIILFDQRGSGRSTPSAELKENTTWHLVDDIEKLKNHLNVKSWVVVGGSWGSTLALAYAETFPASVKAMILCGIFTIRRSEILWLAQGSGASWMFPDHFEDYVAVIPENERGNLLSAYHRRLIGDNADEKLVCAQAWSRWELINSRLIPDLEQLGKPEDVSLALKVAQIESHYFIHGGFLKSDDQLLTNVGKISHLPCIIIQGRYDMCCPPKTAWELKKQWPCAELHMVPGAGHAADELGITQQLLRATESFKHM